MYTTIRELGPIIPSIVWYFGAYFPNSCVYGPSRRAGYTAKPRRVGRESKDLRDPIRGPSESP